MTYSLDETQRLQRAASAIIDGRDLTETQARNEIMDTLESTVASMILFMVHEDHREAGELLETHFIMGVHQRIALADSRSK